MKAHLLFISFLFCLSVAQAHPIKVVANLQLEKGASASLSSDDDDDDDKEKKCNKKHRHYHQCKGYSKHKHDHEKCRERDDDDDNCRHSKCKHRRNTGRVVIELPRIIIPLPASQ